MVPKFLTLLFLGLVTVSSTHGLSLAFSARNLPSMDVGNGAPDAYVIVYYLEAENAPEEYVDETDYVLDNRNPDWMEIFEIKLSGDNQEMLKFEIYDADSPDKDDYMGYQKVKIIDIVQDPDGVITVDLIGGNPGGGQLIIKRQ